MTQISKFKNLSKNSTDVGFVYPKSAKSTFSDLTVYYGDKVVKTRVVKSQEAQIAFKEAINKGDTAVQVSTESRQAPMDTIYTRIGNLLPETEIEIELKIQERIERSEDGVWEFSIPACLKPLYPIGVSDYPSYCLDGSLLQKFFKDFSDFKNNSDNIPPPLLKNYVHISSEKEDYPWNIEVTVHTNDEDFECSSPSHQILRVDHDLKNKQRFILDPEKPQRVDSDFTFKFKDPSLKIPRVIVSKWEDNKETPCAFDIVIEPEVIVELVDKEELKIWDSDDEDELLNEENEQKIEYTFILDRSGSMYGTPIEVAKEALIYFLKSIEEGHKFNIYSFGSMCKKHFSEAVDVNDKNIEKAIKIVKKFEANFGGTELTIPMRDFCSQPAVNKNSKKVAFLLTDGFVFNSQILINCIKSDIGDNRIFTMGIGKDFSKFLVDEIAFAGNGCSVYCQDAENITRSTISLLKKSFGSFLTVTDFEFDEELLHFNNFTTYDDERSANFTVIKGEKMRLSGLLNPNIMKKGAFEIKFKIKLNDTKSPKEYPYSVKVPISDFIETDALHKSIAQEIITNFQKERPLYQFNHQRIILELITDLSINNSILSDFTSMVAIIKSNPKKPENWPEIDEEEFKKYKELNGIALIKVKTITGKTLELAVDLTTNTTLDLKNKVQDSEGIPPDQQRMLYAGKQMEDDKKLSDYEVANGSVVHLVLRLRGGGVSYNFKINDRRTGIVSEKVYQFHGGHKFSEVFNAISQDYQVQVDDIVLENGNDTYNNSQNGENYFLLNGMPDVLSFQLSSEIAKILDKALNRLVEAQRVNGSWVYSEEFLKNLIEDMELLNEDEGAELPQEEGERDVWVTRVVLRILDEKFSGESDKLIFIKAKAKKWLKKFEEI